jgi:hypothetical protein
MRSKGESSCICADGGERMRDAGWWLLGRRVVVSLGAKVECAMHEWTELREALDATGMCNECWMNDTEK